MASFDEKVKEIVDETYNPRTISIDSLIKDTVYPTGSVDVYIDYSNWLKVSEIEAEIESLKQEVDEYEKKINFFVFAEGAPTINELEDSQKELEFKVAELESHRKEIVEKLKSNRLEFELIGVDLKTREETNLEALTKNNLDPNVVALFQAKSTKEGFDITQDPILGEYATPDFFIRIANYLEDFSAGLVYSQLQKIKQYKNNELFGKISKADLTFDDFKKLYDSLLESQKLKLQERGGQLSLALVVSTNVIDEHF